MIRDEAFIGEDKKPARPKQGPRFYAGDTQFYHSSPVSRVNISRAKATSTLYFFFSFRFFTHSLFFLSLSIDDFRRSSTNDQVLPSNSNSYDLSFGAVSVLAWALDRTELRYAPLGLIRKHNI